MIALFHDYIITGKLTGMHESTTRIKSPISLSDAKTTLLNAANVRPVESSDDMCIKFAALTFSGKLPLLLSLKSSADDAILISVNCEKMVFGSMICKLAKEQLLAHQD